MRTFEIDDDVRIRVFSDTDSHAVYGAVVRNYDHLKTFMAWIKPDYSLADAAEFVERSIAERKDKKSLSFGIFRGEALIGSIGFAYFDQDAKVTEIGYWIDAAEEGKGIVSRASKLLIDFAFAELGMNRLQIRCATVNSRSSAIPERFGFKKEGVQRQHIIRDGKLYDFAIYGLLASEWKGFGPEHNI